MELGGFQIIIEVFKDVSVIDNRKNILDLKSKKNGLLGAKKRRKKLQAIILTRTFSKRILGETFCLERIVFVEYSCSVDEQGMILSRDNLQIIHLFLYILFFAT